MIQGIRRKESDGCIIYFITSISEELKKVIRERLKSICHGRDLAKSSLTIYSYKQTVTEFVKRYKEKEKDQSNNNRNKGMIGELLFHIMMTEENLYRPVSAFFNLEERSFKKGFDINYYKVDTSELWIAEVKSGKKKSSQKSVNTTVASLINTAKNNLKTRLTSENNSLWMNAINHARNSIGDSKEEKAVVCKILGDYADQASAGVYTSNDKNVMLVGVVFHDTNEAIEEKQIKSKLDKIVCEKFFNSCVIVCIQQNDYNEVYKFLEEEAVNEK